MAANLIEISNLHKKFGQGKKEVWVLRGLNFSIKRKETFCIVGESGCGKTTLGRILANIESYSKGSYRFSGQEVKDLTKKDLRSFKKDVQMIHQDPFASLNPVQTIFSIIANPLKRHNITKKYNETYKEVSRILDLVGLTPVEDFLDKYPHQLSGGQKQRVSIARALTLDPSFMVVDEAVSMIDTSLRISILNSLKELQMKYNVSFFFITHDLTIANYFAKEGRIAVMYLGKIVELGETDELIYNAKHPYTKALIGAIPEADPIITKSKERFQLKEGNIPELKNIPFGCAFNTRCPWAEEPVCYDKDPLLIGSEEHQVACHVVNNN